MAEKHQYDPNVERSLVLVGPKSFSNDVVNAVETCLEKCQGDEMERKRVEPPLVKILQIVPVSITMSNTQSNAINTKKYKQ